MKVTTFLLMAVFYTLTLSGCQTTATTITKKYPPVATESVIVSQNRPNCAMVGTHGANGSESSALESAKEKLGAAGATHIFLAAESENFMASIRTYAGYRCAS